MNGKALFEKMSKGQMPDRIPFVPTLFEHSAKVINKTPSQVAQSEDLIVESQLASYEIYKHDLIAVGVDIYNVELEALGATVKYHDNDAIPAIEEILIENREDLAKLKIPNPQEAMRMPLFLNAVDKINKAVGNEVIVNGTIVGPFTLAANLRGFENYIMDLMLEPEFALEVLEFSKSVGLAYAKAFIDIGVGISINESWIAPPLLSPSLYKEYILQVQTDMIATLKTLGQKNVALISGGNTTVIAEDMITTGTSLLMADYCTDQLKYKALCRSKDIALRASIESSIVKTGTKEQMYAQCKEVIHNCADYEKFIFGCGVVSYDTDVKRLLELKGMVGEIGSQLR